MEPITIIAIIAAALAGAAIVYVIWLTWDDIVDWFRGRSAIKKADRDNIAFTIKENLDSGNYKVIQGIFNPRTEEVLDNRVIEAENLDPELADAHRQDQLVIYE